jgi:hypothetical protein
MPKKRPASQWQPAGLELLAVSSLYGDAKLRELAGMIGSPRGKNPHRFGIALRNTLGRLNASLHYERRPRSSEKQAAIEAVARPLSELRAALSKLDPYTRELVLAAAQCDPWDEGTEPPLDWCPGGLADLRVSRALDGVESLARWVPRVEEAIGESKSGRPKQEAIQRAITELREIWTRYTGREPTLSYKGRTKSTSGPFLDFCRAALAPLLKKRGIKANLERPVRIALYG